MKQIAIDCRLINKGGIGRYIYSLLKEYKKINPPFEFLLLGDPEALSNVGLGEIIPFKAPIYSLVEQVGFPRLNVNLLHSPHYNIPVFYRGKLVVTIHDLAHIVLPQFFKNPFLRKFAKLMMKTAIGKATRFITVSTFSLSEIEKTFDFSINKGIVIYPGVERSVFYKRERKEIDSVKKRYGIEESYILFVGNIKPHKNIDGVIRAFRLVESEFDNLVIVGKFEGLKTRVKDFYKMLSDNIVFIERINDDELASLYSGAECLLFPSFYEGFGLPAIEALACGTVPIVSDMPVFREILCDACLFVDPNDINSIINGLLSLKYDNELRNKILSESKRVMGKFGWDKTATRTLEVYAEVLGA